MAGSITSFGYFMIRIQTRSINGTTTQITRLPMLLSEDGFDTLYIKRVQVTYSSGKDSSDHYPLNVSFYKVHCDSISTSISNLPVVRNPIFTPILNIRTSYNYYNGDNGLYAGGRNSTLEYVTVANWTTSPDIPMSSLSDICPMKLYLFNNKEKYLNFIDGDAATKPEGYIAESDCLPMKGAGNVTHLVNKTAFALDTPSVYYVGGYFQQGISVQINISAYINNYSLKGLQKDDCYINQQVNTCTLTITDQVIASSHAQVCILSYSQLNKPLTLNYETIGTGISNIGSFLSITTLIVPIVLCIMLLVVSVAWTRKYYMKRQHSGNLLINSHYRDYGNV